MIDHKIVDRALPYRLVHICKKLLLKPCLHSVNQSNLLIHNKIRVITNPIRQRPKPLKKHLVKIVYTDVVYSITDLLHNLY